MDPEPTIEYALDCCWQERLLKVGYHETPDGCVRYIWQDTTIEAMQVKATATVNFYIMRKGYHSRTTVLSSRRGAYRCGGALIEFVKRKFFSIIYFDQELQKLCGQLYGERHGP